MRTTGLQEQFRGAYRSSFEHFINSAALGGGASSSSSSSGGGGNSGSSKVSELLCRHFDKKLRGTEKGLSDRELEQYLDKCLALFFYISSKDMFEAFYRKHLARRLLLGKCANTDLERSIIAKLKQVRCCILLQLIWLPKANQWALFVLLFISLTSMIFELSILCAMILIFL